MWSGNIKTALSSLRMSKWRSILTMMGIIIGISSVVTVVSLGEGLKQQISGQINQLGSNVLTIRSGKLVKRQGGSITGVNILAFLSASTLSPRDTEVLQKISTQDAVAPINFVTSSATGETSSSDNLFVVGTSADLPKLVKFKVEFGSFFNSDAEEDNVAVIGAGVAHSLFGELNPVGHTIKISGTDFGVRGVLEPTIGSIATVAQTDFNSSVFIPFSPSIKLTGGSTNIQQIMVRSKNGDLDRTVKDVHKTLLQTHDGQQNFTILKQNELLSITSSVVNLITSFISGIAAISLLVGGIGIMDIMLVSVSERTREIGVRKAIGATNRQILNQFLVEGSVLSIGGGLIGIFSALVINLLLRLYTSFHPLITITTMALAVGISVAVGIIFSVAPALKAAHKNPIDALRGE
jgi:putative ABC transport system permease protein